MAIKRYKPVTPTQRFKAISAFDEITRSEPEKSLIAPMRKKAGRNHSGHITIRRRGGGHKKRYRIVDFKRDKHGIPACVKSIEYDPNRSSRIALLVYTDGEKRYIIAPFGVSVGQKIVSGPEADVSAGNYLPISRIPLGTMIHSVELVPGKGAQIARSAGTSVQLLSKEGRFANLKLPSGEVRMVDQKCYAAIGQVGNIDHGNIVLGKAGASRWLGRRPKVRGVAMNPVDHPLGGGEGKSSGGRHPVTPWGKPTKGYRTRKAHKPSDRYIVSRRK